MKNILFVSSECVPFIKTGGLADVVGSLPKCFDKKEYDVRVFLPKYSCMKEKYKNDKRYSGVPDSVILENLKEEIADTLICIKIMQDITGITDSEIEEKVEEKHERNLLLCRDAQS